MSSRKTEKENPCKPEIHEAECDNFRPQIFPQIRQFPPEGILGMYPISTACKKQVAEHMVEFQKKLKEKYEDAGPTVNAKITDYRNPNPLAESLDRVTGEMKVLEYEIEELKHKIAVEMIKQKYTGHEPYCPCYNKGG